MPSSTPVFGPLPENVALRLGMSKAATMSQAPQGMTSEVAFVNDHERESVVKRCRNPVYIEWLRREHRVLAALAECSLRLPRVIGYHEARQDTQVVDADLALDNVLIDDDGSLGLIDWSGGDLGDPRYDIALTLATEPEVPLRDVEVAAFSMGISAHESTPRRCAGS